MRVLMVSQFYKPVLGGSERAVQNLSIALAGRGHHVAVATLSLPGTPAFEFDDGVAIHRLRSTMQRARHIFVDPQRTHMPPVPDPELVLALRRLIDHERPDVIHAHDWLVHSLMPIRRTRHIPLVLSLHEFGLVCSNKRMMRGTEPCTGPSPLKCTSCSAARFGVAKGVPMALAVMARRDRVRAAVDMFLPVSRAVAIHSRLRADDNFQVLPNVLAPESSGTADTASTLARELPGDDFVLFVGDATFDKGASVLLKAHAMLATAAPLVFIGRTEIPELAAPPGNVRVLGVRSPAEVMAALRRCAVVAIPSLCPETFGMVALEAMAAGTPVVASATGGLVDLVTDAETGFLTPPGDADALATALSSLLDDRERRRRMGIAARRRSEAFAAPSIVSRLEDIYRKVAARPEFATSRSESCTHHAGRRASRNRG